MVGMRHGYGSLPEAREGGMAIEERAVLGVDVEEIKGEWLLCERALDVAKKAGESGKREGGVGSEGRGWVVASAWWRVRGAKDLACTSSFHRDMLAVAMRARSGLSSM